jgi:DNA-binding CsgD family transcriptional regulator
MEEIKEAKGRKKGAALVNLEKEIKDKNNAMENSYDFQKRIDILSNEFYNSLLKQFPSLSKNEIKLCSLIRLDLDNYDIATLQNVDVSSVYKSRYRLRKKLDITSDTDLNSFLKAL